MNVNGQIMYIDVTGTITHKWRRDKAVKEQSF